MTKVVVNSCFGGFSLSNQGVEALAKKKGISIWWFNLNTSTREIEPCTDPERAIFAMAYTHEEGPNSKKGEYFDSRPEQRGDPDLVAVVEELGEAANGAHAELRIVDVPDNVQWVVEEYDGKEWVSEQHRTWS